MKLIRIIVFYSIALLGSYIFRIAKPDFINSINLPFGFSLLKHLFEGIGPILGAIIVLAIFKPNKKITLWGTSKVKSISMLAIPLILFVIIGVRNQQGINTHWYGFIVAISSLLYVVFEEFGWRGYLLDELKMKQSNPIIRAILIGILWYIWHLNFNINSETLQEHLVFLALLIFASWGFEKITDTTKSVISVACFHLLGSLMGYNQMIQDGINSNSRILIFGICLIAWIIIVSKWDKQKSANKV